MWTLFIFDVGGVFRDSSLAINEGFKRGFNSCGFSYNFKADDVWHLRGIGKYNNSYEAIKALLAISKTGLNLNSIVNKDEPEKFLDELIRKTISKKELEISEKVRKGYKEFFNSPEANKLIRIYPWVKEAIDLLHKKFRLAIFTNTSLKTVARDLPGTDLKKFSLILSEKDVEKKKPSGEGITKIIKKLNIPLKETVYVGDSVVDILAARDVYCKAVAVTCGMGLKKHLEKEKPDFIFGNILEMAKYFLRT